MDEKNSHGMPRGLRGLLGIAVGEHSGLVWHSLRRTTRDEAG